MIIHGNNCNKSCTGKFRTANSLISYFTSDGYQCMKFACCIGPTDPHVKMKFTISTICDILTNVKLNSIARHCLFNTVLDQQLSNEYLQNTVSCWNLLVSWSNNSFQKIINQWRISIKE